jgi:ubiquinone/menaquinone biosynthesis C-methylase UbiE
VSKKFDPARLQRLVSEERAEWQSIERFLEVLRPEPGKEYADIGCGPGYFTLPVAELIRPQGRVYAIDIEPEMLAECERRAREQGLQEVVIPVQSSEHAIPLPDGSVDAAWLANVYHELDAPVEFLGEIKRVLRPEGRFLLIDWKAIETPAGPPLEHRVSLEEISAALKRAGFARERVYDIYPFHHVIESFAMPS